MTDTELFDFLSRKGALVVHLSHHVDMRQGVLSCVVVWPGHTMKLPGSIGVIFEPTCASVISASNDDAGSSVRADESARVLLTTESLSGTFEVVGRYNKWRVRGAKVVGIFVADPRRIETKREVEYEISGTKYKTVSAEVTSLTDVFAAFPSLRVFAMRPAGKIELDRP